MPDTQFLYWAGQNSVNREPQEESFRYIIGNGDNIVFMSHLGDLTEDADPASFRVFDRPNFAKDARHIYQRDCRLSDDPAHFELLDGNLSNIVSNSYGDLGEDVPADVIAGETNLYLQAAGEGIGLYFSSGDSGDETPNGLPAQPDFPASSPWVMIPC